MIPWAAILQRQEEVLGRLGNPSPEKYSRERARARARALNIWGVIALPWVYAF